MKKTLLGIVLGIVAIFTIGMTSVKAAENFTFVEEFGTSTAEVGTVDNTADYSIHSLPSTVESSTIVADSADNYYLQFAFPASAASSTIAFRNTSTSTIYTGDTDVVVKLRFRTSNTHRFQIQLYSGSTITVLNATTSLSTENLSGVAVSEVGSVSFESNTWYEVAFVIIKDTRMLYTYVNDAFLYSASITNDSYDAGKLTNINFALIASSSRPAQTLDFDYIYVGEYNGGTASVDDTYTTSVGSTFTTDDLNLEISGTNSSFDPSMSAYSVVVDEEYLSYDSSSDTFEAIEQGETTIEFDFVDPLIEDVSTTVTINEASSAILVQGVALNYFSNDTIELVEGESFDLNDLFSVTNSAATNKTLNYTASSDGVYSLDGTTITGVSEGSSSITVKSNDGNFEQSYSVVVSDGYLADLPEVGSEYSETGITYTNGAGENFTSVGYSSRTYSPISVVNDSSMGKTFSYTGVGSSNAGGSYINWWVDGSNLTSGTSYKLVVFAKVTGDISGAPRVDLQINGYNLISENAYNYDSILYTTQQNTVSSYESWVIYETDAVTYDELRNEGFKMQLVSFNNSEGMTTLIGHVKLVAVEGEAELKSVSVTSGDLTLATSSATAPTLTISDENSVNVTVTPIPSMASLGEVVYSSDNEEVATVVDGVITPVSNGSATITVVVNGTTYYLNVVVNIAIPVESIVVEDTNLTIDVSDITFNIPITINPEDYTDTINFDFDDSVIASVGIVSGRLYITPKAAGSSSIVITVDGNDDISVTINVTVTSSTTEEPSDDTSDDVACTGISVNSTSVSLEVGETFSIVVTLTPTDTTDTITYSSSNSAIASVSATGTITAVSEGTATITVTCGDQSATITVTVSQTAETTPTDDSSSNTGLIIGCVVGGVVVLLAIGGVVYFVVIKKKK